ncbi:hypothetical protein D3C80_762800 [compost metagenome]
MDFPNSIRSTAELWELNPRAVAIMFARNWVKCAFFKISSRLKRIFFIHQENKFNINESLKTILHIKPWPLCKIKSLNIKEYS